MSNIRLYLVESWIVTFRGWSWEKGKAYLITSLVLLPLTLLIGSAFHQPTLGFDTIAVWLTCTLLALLLIVSPFRIWQTLHQQAAEQRIQINDPHVHLESCRPRPVPQDVLDFLSGYIDMASEIQDRFIGGKDAAHFQNEYGAWAAGIELFLSWNLGQSYAARLRKPREDLASGLLSDWSIEVRNCWVSLNARKQQLREIMHEVGGKPQAGGVIDAAAN